MLCLLWFFFRFWAYLKMILGICQTFMMGIIWKIAQKSLMSRRILGIPLIWMDYYCLICHNHWNNITFSIIKSYIFWLPDIYGVSQRRMTEICWVWANRTLNFLVNLRQKILRVMSIKAVKTKPLSLLRFFVIFLAFSTSMLQYTKYNNY